ncbi:MAG: TetR/AcrR family transcriptional regulator [Candidatus Dormibacteria bacterium]
MPRTLNPVAHAVRRDEFLDAAQWLIQTKGYEQMSIQDILDRTEASRGALYHYFDSKAALLAAIVDRLVETATAAVASVPEDPALSAREKFARVFGGIARWKSERRDLMLALVRVWYSDENALLRDKLRAQMLVHLAPLVARIVEQGRADGAFTVADAEETAHVILSLLYGAREAAGEMFFARAEGAIPFAAVRRRFGAYSTAVERILGVPEGSLPIVDDATLHEWFD